MRAQGVFMNTNTAKGEGTSNVRRILSLLIPFKLRIAIVIACALVSSALTTIQPLLRQRLIDEGVIGGSLREVIFISLFIFGLFAVNQLSEAIQFFNYTYISKMLTFKLFHTAFKHLMKLPVSFFKDSNSTQIIGNIEYDVSNIARISDSVFVTSFVQGLCMIGGAVGLAIINWQLALLVLCIIPVKILINSYYSKKRIKAFENIMEIYTKFAEWKGETVQGIHTIKLWNVFRRKLRDFTGLRREIIHNEYRLAETEQGNSITSNTVDALLNGALYVLCAYFIFKGQLTVGGLFSFTSYSSVVIGSISFLTRIKFYFAPVFPSLKRYFEFMETKEEHSGYLEVSQALPHIEFKNVTLHYNDKATALKDISFEMNAGEKIAVVGANGSGKSSIIQLLLHFFEPSDGKITYCGTDIREIKLGQYRNLFSCVEQKSFIFNASVRENIDPISWASDEKMMEIAEVLGVSAFVSGLPDGLDTAAGVDGSKFSGGERQKLAMLRAWVKPHKVLILDEVTNNLDIESENLINELMIHTDSSKIVIVVTHRVHILDKVDKILFMNNGELVGLGTFAELSVSCPEFLRFIRQINH